MKREMERGLTRTLDGSTLSTLINPEGEEVEHRVPTVIHHQQQAVQEPAPRVPVVHHPVAAAPPPQPLIIGNLADPTALDEMEKKKERIVLLSLQRRQAAEDARNRKEMEAAHRREEEKYRQEERLRKKDDDRKRRATILEQHKIKKAIEEAEREGKQIDKELLNCLKAGLGGMAAGGSAGPKMRPRTQPARPRPKTVHMDSDITDSPGLTPSRGKKGSSSNLSGGSSIGEGECDSGLGRGTRAPSPSGPGSLPLRSRKPQPSSHFDDAASEAGSDYSGPRLYRQPTTKSNKGIIVNAIEYCVFPGVVNMEMKRKVLDAVNRSDAKHFLVLFRDAGCQFRALYTYHPDTEEISKLHGIGPKHVTDRMFDKFFKYNSGGKCFSQVHTKHLTVTIDAFTIHNSLWQGKKVNFPNKADMTLVI